MMNSNEMQVLLVLMEKCQWEAKCMYYNMSTPNSSQWRRKKTPIELHALEAVAKAYALCKAIELN